MKYMLDEIVIKFSFVLVLL